MPPGRLTVSPLQIVCDRPVTIGSQAYMRGAVIEVEDWRGIQLIEHGIAWHAKVPSILYETTARKQSDDRLRYEGVDQRHAGDYVTCLCLTRNRREWLPKAIRFYQEQTFANRELLIIADGEDVKDLIPDDESIRLIHIEEAKPPYTVGAKRNFGCEHALGSVIAHWDDDDVSSPRRLEEQIAFLRSSGKAVVGFNSMVFANGAERYLYSGTRDYALGTSLCYRKDWWQAHPFLCVQIGEDGEFVKEARYHGKIACVEAGDLMMAIDHDRNTSPRDYSKPEWTRLA